MRSKDGAYTPKEKAADIAIGWIKRVHQERTDDLAGESAQFVKETKKHLAKLHNQLLDKSGLHGMPLE